MDNIGFAGTPPTYSELESSSMLAFDIESTGTNIGASIPLGLSLACGKGGAVYVPIDHPYKQLLANEGVLKLAHNASFDRAMLKKAGVEANNICCTMVAAHMLEDTSLSLFMQAATRLHKKVLRYEDLAKPINEMSTQELADYSGPHSAILFELWRILEQKMKNLRVDKPFWNVEMPVLPVLSDIECNGVAVNAEVLTSLGTEFDGKICELIGALDFWSQEHGMNHNSPDQVSALLYVKFGLPKGPVLKKDSRWSVDKRYLETIAHLHPYIPAYLLMKEYQTLKNSYIKSLSNSIVDGRVYGNLNQTRTATGRLSSSNPNLQKIPQRKPQGKRIRTAFTAPEGKVLVKADYDQLELRMFAHCSKDKDMMKAFNEGRDIHTETAIRLYGDPKRRADGKTKNFQITYGGGSISDRALLYKAYPAAILWTKRIQQAVCGVNGCGFARTIGGRIRTFPKAESEPPHTKMLSESAREAVSTIVQGSSAEEVKKGMTRCWHALKGSGVKMVLQVHDEVVFEVEDSMVDDVAHVVKETMETDELSVPLTVSVSTGKNWGECDEVM